jgi:hypothetical protein
MTTGVRDREHRDFRPIDNVRRFSVGQEAFLTVLVATRRAGTLQVHFCTMGRQVTGHLEVPANAIGRYAEFSLRPTATDVGRGVAILRWGGAVAAVVTFAVTPR